MLSTMMAETYNSTVKKFPRELFSPEVPGRNQEERAVDRGRMNSRICRALLLSPVLLLGPVPP